MLDKYKGRFRKFYLESFMKMQWMDRNGCGELSAQAGRGFSICWGIYVWFTDWKYEIDKDLSKAPHISLYWLLQQNDEKGTSKCHFIYLYILCYVVCNILYIYVFILYIIELFILYIIIYNFIVYIYVIFIYIIYNKRQHHFHLLLEPAVCLSYKTTSRGLRLP